LETDPSNSGVAHANEIEFLNAALRLLSIDSLRQPKQHFTHQK
jgi:hypothetical protein